MRTSYSKIFLFERNAPTSGNFVKIAEGSLKLLAGTNDKAKNFCRFGKLEIKILLTIPKPASLFIESQKAIILSISKW